MKNKFAAKKPFPTRTAKKHVVVFETADGKKFYGDEAQEFIDAHERAGIPLARQEREARSVV